MPPKAAEKKPTTGGKAPAGKAPAEKKEAGKKTAAPAGDKKKRNKTRKETYSSYIYKGILAQILSRFCFCCDRPILIASFRAVRTDCSFVRSFTDACL